MVERRAGSSAPIAGGAPIISLGPRELLDASPDVVFACDQEGTLLWLNRAFDALAGRSAGSLIGRRAVTLVAAGARIRVLHAFMKQRRRRQSQVSLVIPVVCASAREKLVLARVRLLEHADGGAIFVGVAHEVEAGSAEARAAAAGTRAPRGAGEPDVGARPALGDDVLATMSHESRAHMNAIMGMAQLLLDTQLDQDQLDMVQVVRGASQSLLDLVNNAIEYSKLATDTLDLERIAFDLRVAVEETAGLLAAQAQAKKIQFECHVHHEVPSRLWGDPGRLRQVLLHLGENAIGSAAGGRVTLAVDREQEDEHAVTIRFTVMDTSPGTSAEHVTQALEPAGRMELRTSSTSVGPSLGLLIARQVVQLMGGALGAESESVEGSRVWFELPFEMQAEHEPLAAERPARSELVGERVMVVDPSAVMRRTLMAKVEALGCEVAEATGADEALALLRGSARAGRPFRFAVIERELSPGDGEELGASIRAEAALERTLTLLVTSVGRRGDAARARAQGFSAYLPKNIDGDELAEALCEVLRQAAAGSASRALVTRYALAEGRRGRTHILVVEANTVSQLVSQWALNRLGYQVEVVGTAAAAWSACQRATFDVVLVDGQLPHGDTLHLVGEIRARADQERPTVIVAMIDDDCATSRSEWQQAGVEEFIAKPVNLEVMTALVERVTRTGTAWGPEIEDEAVRRGPKGASVHVPSGTGEPEGRVEVVVPDVDRLVTESDVQEAMAAAVRTAMMKTPAPRVPAASKQTVAEAPEPAEPPALEVSRASPEVATPSTPAGAKEPPARESAAAPARAAEVPASAPIPTRTTDAPAPPVVDSPPEAMDTLTVAEVEALEDAAPPAPGPVKPPAPKVIAVTPAEAARPKVAAAAEPTPAAAGESPATIDLAQLAEASMGIPSLREALLGAFVGEIRPRLDRLARALNAGDAEAFRTEAHGLEVLSGTIGARACAAKFADLEKRGESGALEGAVVDVRGAYVEALRAEEQVGKLREERKAA